MLYVSMQDILTWLLANTDDQLLTNIVEQLLDILSPTAGLLVFKHFRKVTIKKCGLLLMAFKYVECCFYFGKCYTFAKGFCEHCASLKLFRSKTICCSPCKEEKDPSKKNGEGLNSHQAGNVGPPVKQQSRNSCQFSHHGKFPFHLQHFHYSGN